MGAPVGNQNAAKGKVFFDALRRAMASDDYARVRKAADKLLDKAAEGEQWAISELANRLDGKAHQSQDITIDAGNSLLSALRRLNGGTTEGDPPVA